MSTRKYLIGHNQTKLNVTLHKFHKPSSHKNMYTYAHFIILFNTCKIMLLPDRYIKTCQTSINEQQK